LRLAKLDLDGDSTKAISFASKRLTNSVLFARVQNSIADFVHADFKAAHARFPREPDLRHPELTPRLTEIHKQFLLPFDLSASDTKKRP
jgi:hypothetical protein